MRVSARTRPTATRGAWLLAGLLAVAAGLLALAAPALATTYRPDKTGDNPAGGLTLREAITTANDNPGSDRVVLQGGRTYRLSLVGSDDLNATGDLDVRDAPLTIESDSKALATVSAEGIDRAFDVINAGASAELVRLRVRGGFTAGDGGAIQVFDGRLSLVRSVIGGNTANDEGGGIASDGGPVSISKSTIQNNVADADENGDGGGGGIFASGEFLRIKSSTVSGNTTAAAQGGGGISVYSDALHVVNSTLTENSATHVTGDGGGLMSSGDQVTINAVTIARNRAGAEGGGFARNGPGSFEVRNSLIALNRAPSGPDCEEQSDTVTSFGQNLVGDNASCSSFSAVSGDRVNLPRTKLGIGRLADNGGLTETIALKRGSRAINAAGSDTPARDQRGRRRHNPDIGAFERTPAD